MKFNSYATYRGDFRADWLDEIVKDEPMFFNSNLQFSYENGGPLTRAFIDCLPQDWKESNPVLDSRVHMLKKGWLPCIGGWHHDDVPRNTSTGQPNYIDPPYRAEHLLGLVNAHVSPTRFIHGVVQVSEPNIDKVVFNEWSHEIDEALRSEQHDWWINEIESGEYVQFNTEAFHAGTKARQDGWRWFVRLSRNTARQRNMTNEIRRQVQVYIENELEGW